VRRLRRTSSQRCHPLGAPALASGRRPHPYQRRPLAPCPALRRSQQCGGMCSASRAASTGGPNALGSGSVALTASTLGSWRPSSQPRSAGLPPSTASAVTQPAGTPAASAVQHHPGQLGLGREPDPGGDAGGLQARGIVSPALGQVQLAVDHPVPSIAGIGQVDGDLGVVDLAGGAGVLASHPHRVGALLAVAGLVDHQHRARVTQVLQQVLAEVVADPVVVPHRPASRCCIPSGLVSPACSASVQQFLRGRSASSPSTNARARRRGSTLANRRATRPSSSSSLACQLAGVTLWPAATV
jgi:hypothetical protein